MAGKKWWQYTTIMAQQIPAFGVPKDFAKSEIALCKRIGAEALFMFVELDGEYIFPTRYAPFYKGLGKRDLLRELVVEATKNRIRILAAFMGQHAQTALARKHPQWAMKGFKDLRANKYVSMGPTCLCLNSPYRQRLQAMARQVIADYGVDGIYFDGVYYPPQFCFCDGCRKQYARLFGKKMPSALRDPNRLKLGEETVVSWSREMRDIINETNPEVCYILDCHATIIGHSDSREHIHKTDQYVDVRIQECYPEIIREQPFYAEFENRSIAAETGKTVWWAKWIPRNPDRNVITNPPAAVRLWGASTLAEKSPICLVCQRVQDFDRRSIPPMQEMARLWKKAKAHVADSETVAPVALFHSLESKLQRLPAKVREHRKGFEGWYLALSHKHIPFDVVSERDLSTDRMKKYTALIVPNAKFMSDDSAAGIRAFAEAGGALIVTGFSSLADEKGRNREDFALADVIGASCRGELNGVIAGRGLTQYYRAFAQHPISRGLERDFYSFASGMEWPKVKLAKDTRGIFYTSAYDESLVKSDKYFVSYPTKKRADVVLAVRERPRRVVIIPAPLDGAYWEDGWPELADIMAKAVRWALRGKLPVETDAEENVWFVLRRNDKKKSWVLHLTNNGVNNQYSIGFDCCFGWDKPDSQSYGHPVRICFKTAAFTVSLKSIRGKKLSARSLTGNKVALKKGAGGWRLEHPGLKEYDVIVLEEK
jgi:hypothetical protein